MATAERSQEDLFSNFSEAEDSFMFEDRLITNTLSQRIYLKKPTETDFAISSPTRVQFESPNSSPVSSRNQS